MTVHEYHITTATPSGRWIFTTNLEVVRAARRDPTRRVRWRRADLPNPPEWNEVYDDATLDAVVAKLIERRGLTKWASDAHVITLAIKDIEGLRAPADTA